MRGFLDFLLRRPFLVVVSCLAVPTRVAPRSGPGGSGRSQEQWLMQKKYKPFKFVSLNGIYNDIASKNYPTLFKVITLMTIQENMIGVFT